MRHRPCSLVGAGYAAVPIAILRSRSRGAERRQTRELARLPMDGRRDHPGGTSYDHPVPPCDRRNAPSGAPRAAFCVPLSRASVQRQTPPSKGASFGSGGHRSVVAVTCSHSRQPVVMPADGWPGPPGGLGYEPRPRAPHQHDRVSPILSGETTRPYLRPHPSPLLRPRHVSGDAPRRAGQADNRDIALLGQ